jgi:hypothetical protein
MYILSMSMTHTIEHTTLAIKIQIWLSYIIRTLFVLNAVYSVYQQAWWHVFIAVLGIGCLSLPALLAKNYKIILPTEFEFAFTVFIFATQILGTIHGFYTSFWWWDAALHTSSGVALGFIGFLILYTLQKQRRLNATPYWLSIFAFSFAVALGTLWEIFEFMLDTLFGMQMQDSGYDTMSDLIVNAIGAFISVAIGFMYLKNKRYNGTFFYYLLHTFISNNAHLLPKKTKK